MKATKILLPLLFLLTLMSCETKPEDETISFPTHFEVTKGEETATYLQVIDFYIQLAKEFTGNNEELAYELFDMLRAELDSYKDAILLAVEKSDLVKLRETVHKLHGASRCCGTTELKKCSSHIETMITQNINFDIRKETDILLKAIRNVADYKIKNR